MASQAECDNCSRPAVSFCEDCPGLMCPTCLSDHRLTTAFSSHSLLDLSSRGEGQQGEALRYALCPDHHTAINYYCHDCSQGLCRQCVPRVHAQHKVEQLGSLVPARKAQLEQTLTTLTAIAKEFHAHESEPEMLRGQAESITDQAENDFQLHLENIQKTLKEWEGTMRRDFDTRRFSIVRDVDKILSVQSGHLFQVKELEDETQRLLTPNIRPLEVIEKGDELIKRLELLKIETEKTQTEMFVTGANYVPKVVDPKVGYLQDVTIGPKSDEHNMSFWTNSQRGSGLGELLAPCDVLLLPDGRLLLADWGNSRLQAFSSSGKSSSVLLQDLTPQRLAATQEGLLLVSDDKNRTVVSFTSEGQVVKVWKPLDVVRPWGIAVNRDSSWVITDYAESKGFIYTPDGMVRDTFGGYGYLEEWMLNLPSYVCCDLHGRVLVSDCNRHSVKIFDSNGRFISSFSKRGLKDGELRYPRGVCVDSANNIIVADWGNDRVSQFSPDGQFISHVFPKDTTGPFGWPCGLSFQSGMFNDGKPRLAITSENPDGLFVIPYHHQTEDLEQPQDAQDVEVHQSQGQDTNYAIEAVESGIVVWEKDNAEEPMEEESIPTEKFMSESPPAPSSSRKQSNRRRVSHGSGSGQSRSGWEETKSLERFSTEWAPSGKTNPKNHTMPLENSPSSTVHDPTSPRGSKDSVKHTSGGRRNKSSASSRSSGPQSRPDSDHESLDLLDSTYVPSTGEPRNKRTIKSDSKPNRQKRTSRPPRQSLNEESLESIPERFSFSSEGEG